ncbi:hypothetical protein THAOC_07435 [Thalassiosira oceanica]|uniref:Uncharacterized protein n=1 Tax=Thalassiosira oceanica TaxID=159749 RepID=K0TKG8_THAOC|nr:hypothetical protein THAOC_07435 [Thalassiosira oceanica]|eukprot:EJK71152.1 hypothetical protein THAOC_07435 [Thalassiosira oceanica]
MPASAVAASSARRRQEIGTKIVRTSGEIVRGVEKTETEVGRSFSVPVTKPRPYATSSMSRKTSQHSSVGSGTFTTTGMTAAGRQSHYPYAISGDSSPSKRHDLELLGLTVQSINAALSSGAVPAATASPVRAQAAGPDAAAKSGQSGEAQPYMLSRAKFQPRGCVWDVSIQVLPAWEAGECDNSATWECTRQSISKQGLKLKSGFEFDVKIHCVADESPSDDPDGVVDGPPDGGKAMVDTPSSLKDTATRNTYTIELTLVHDNPDERVLWRDYPAEISGAMEWLRRKIRRKLKLSVGRRFPVPAVEIVLLASSFS